MQYLKNVSEISNLITEYAQAKILWIDTEVADFTTRNPRLSLIQLLRDPSDRTGDRVAILSTLR